MLDIGMLEIFVIGALALIVVGPKELPGLLRTVGQFAANGLDPIDVVPVRSSPLDRVDIRRIPRVEDGVGRTALGDKRRPGSCAHANHSRGPL